jgi:hypothetical protein
MRQLLGILILLGALWLGKELFQFWEGVRTRREAEDRAAGIEPSRPAAAPAAAPAPAGNVPLPGLPVGLEASLQSAQKQGAQGLKNWLRGYRTQVMDPRLASIELDYVVLIGASDLKEARRVLVEVRRRTSTNSPVYPRLEQLERSYR